MNPIDWKLVTGMMSGGRPLTGTRYLGLDASGVVDEVGEGVKGVSVGDEALGRGSDTQAEYAVLDAWVAKPPSVDWAVAASAGVAGGSWSWSPDPGETRSARGREVGHGQRVR